MMKRILSVICAAVLLSLILCLAGCGGTQQTEPTDAPTEAVTEAPTVAPTEAVTEAPTIAPKDLDPITVGESTEYGDTKCSFDDAKLEGSSLVLDLTIEYTGSDDIEFDHNQLVAKVDGAQYATQWVGRTNATTKYDRETEGVTRITTNIEYAMEGSWEKFELTYTDPNGSKFNFYVDYDSIE